MSAQPAFEDCDVQIARADAHFNRLGKNWAYDPPVIPPRPRRTLWNVVRRALTFTGSIVLGAAMVLLALPTRDYFSFIAGWVFIGAGMAGLAWWVGRS